MRNRVINHAFIWMMAERSKPPKRAHKSFTIDQKIEILNQICRKSYKVLKDEYGIGISTILLHQEERTRTERVQQKDG